MTTTTTKAFTGVKSVPQPDSACLKLVPVDVEFASAAYVADDLIKLVELPPGVGVVDYAFIFPDIDTGTPAFAFSFGELNDDGDDLAVTYASGLTAGQSTTIVRATTSVAAQAAKTESRVLAIKVTTAAATYAGADKVGQVLLGLRG